MTFPADPIIFYDIASGPPVTCFAPNPWKARFALNFKGLHYKTSWTDLSEVTSVRKSLGVPPCRKHWKDNTDFYTLPVIKDQSTGAIVGDSFEIAEYLDKAYPEKPTLIPPGAISLVKAFNGQADQVFTMHVVLTSRGFPFNPVTEDVCKREFCRRVGLDSWEDILQLGEGENRPKLMASLERALGEEPLDGLSKAFLRRDEGPFLNGKDPMYADLIIGAWLEMYKRMLPKEEWEQLCTWHDGLWGRLSDALEQYKQVDSDIDE